MKVTAVLLILLMTAGIFGPCVIVGAEVSSVPHEDPNAARSTLDSLSFLTQYADIFALMSNGQYANASQLSQQLSYITVPDDLSYLINRYNNLTQQLITKLSDLDTTLNNASRLLDQYRLADAREALDHAGVVVAEAQILLSDLQDATATVTQKIGVFAAAAGSKIQQAYAQLQSMLDRLQQLIDRYHQLLQNADQKYNEVKNGALKATSITLSLSATACYVGGYVTAAGDLTSEGQGLANRAVTLLLDGDEVLTVNTNANGSYVGSVQIPYRYVNSVSIQAYYTPTGGDEGTYLGSTSPTRNVKALYYHTVLNLSAPVVAYPGLPLTVKGTVESESGVPLDRRQVKVLLDGTVVSQDTTDVNGTFSAKPNLSSSTKLGNHTLTVSVGASGLYAGTSTMRNFTVTKMTTTLDVSVPASIMLPAQIHLNGTVRAASGPLYNASVIVQFADISGTALTERDGSFNLTLNVPFSSVLAGGQTLKVIAQPTQAWQAAATKTVSLFVLNALSIGLMSSASLAVVLVLYFRFAKGKSKKTPTIAETVATITAPKAEVPVVVPTVVTEKKFEGSAGKVVKAYVEAISAVQSATGLSATPTMTLREYLRLASPKLNSAGEPFSKLTSLTEISLYSIHPTEESAVKRAEELASAIKRNLNGTT